MKTLYSILIAISMLTSGITIAAEMENHNLFNDQLNLDIASELRQLSTSSIKKKYGKQQFPPAYVFSNKKHDVSFTITQYPNPADKASMKKIHQSISSILRKANQGASWKKDKIYSRLDTKVAVFEYETKAVGKYKYNITYALPVGGKLTFISFVTTEKKYKNKWVTIARKTMDSIKL